MPEEMRSATHWADHFSIRPEVIWQWKSRGLITPDGLDDAGRPVYLQLTIATAEAATAARAGRI